MQHNTGRVQHPPELGTGASRQPLTDVFVPVFGGSSPPGAGSFDGFPHSSQDSRARSDVEELLNRRLVHQAVH